MKRFFLYPSLFKVAQIVFLFGLFLVLSIPATAQTSYFEQNDWRENYIADTYHLDLPKESRLIESNVRPYQFAVPVKVNRSIYLGDEDNGLDGYFHYFYSIVVTDAQSINFTLEGLNKANVVAVYVNSMKSIFDLMHRAIINLI
ncbi:MAG: hypothetical protein C0599_02150 [Salinivirgaceae bacterium]|nr:MAG: hypothetical protein C0599_02150 [Salinivirgaceae bacterium]